VPDVFAVEFTGESVIAPLPLADTPVREPTTVLVHV
jgi:hypothetical protein